MSNFKIFVDDELIAFDSLHFSPKEEALGGIGVLEGAMYIGSIWLVSPKAADSRCPCITGNIAGRRRIEGRHDTA